MPNHKAVNIQCRGDQGHWKVRRHENCLNQDFRDLRMGMIGEYLENPRIL